MRRTLFLVPLLAAAAGLVPLDARAAQIRRTEIAATAVALFGENMTYGDFSHIGPGVRIDLNPARWLTISPEISYLAGRDGGLSFAATVNGRFGPAYAGLGVVSLNKTAAIFFKEHGVITNAFLKVHAGLKGRHWLSAIFYVTDSLSRPWLHGFGVTVGYIF